MPVGPQLPKKSSKSLDNGKSIYTFSIIIPYRNRLRKLRRAVNSVREQTLSDWELILVDDHSRKSFDLNSLHDPRIRQKVLPKNLGPGTARNQGMLEAQGKYIAFLDSDDYWSPQFLEKLSRTLENNPEAVFAYAYTNTIEGKRKNNNQPCTSILPHILNEGRPWCTSACLWRKKSIDRMGPWLPTFCWEDYHFDIQAAIINNEVACLPEVLCHYDMSGEGRLSSKTVGQKILDKQLALREIAHLLGKSGYKEDEEVRHALNEQLLATIATLFDHDYPDLGQELIQTAYEWKGISFWEYNMLQILGRAYFQPSLRARLIRRINSTRFRLKRLEES